MSSDDDSLKDAEILSDNEQNDFLDNVATENTDENPEENTEEVQRDENTDGENQDVQPVKVKRIIRNPQPKLNAETVKGPRGIAAIASYFERVKFKGKGHENQDLNVIMKTYEYWCHRLFPKFPFDTCIDRLEKLGSKRPVQTHIKRIRFDLITEPEDKPIIDSSDEEANVEGFVDINNDQINQQFDDLVQNQQPEPELTTAQLEIIRINKEKAEKLRQERLRNIREKAALDLVASQEVSSQVATTSGINDYLQSTQSSQEENNESEPLELPVFDLESNIKGKATLKGSTIKKTSKKLTNGKQSKKLFDSDIDIESGINDPNSNDEVSSKDKGRHVIDSDEDSDEDVPIKATSNLSEKFKRNVFNSDESDQEMVTSEDPLNGKTSIDTNKSVLDSDQSDHDMVIDEDPSQEDIPCENDENSTDIDKNVELPFPEKGTLPQNGGITDKINGVVSECQIEDENGDSLEPINSVDNVKLVNNLSEEVNSENKENSSVDNIF